MSKGTIRIGTSEAGGTFHTQGLAIAEVARAAGVTDTIVVETTLSASVGNARRLDAGELEFGFMASNWIGRAKNGEPPFDRPVALRMVSPVNAGPLFFITLASSPLRSVSDLVGRRIAVGLEDSGMVQHVHTMFDVLGISFEDFTPIYLAFADGAEALEAGEADAQFQCPIPNQVMTDLSRRTDIRVLDHGPGSLDRLIAAVPFYRPVMMAAGALPGLHADTTQAGVLNVLVTHERVARETVAEIVRNLQMERPDAAVKPRAPRARQRAGAVTATPTIQVETPSRRYTVELRAKVDAWIAGGISRACNGDRIAVITDQNVGPLHADRLVSQIRAQGKSVTLHTVAAGESSR